MFAAYHQMCLPTSSSTVSTSRRADALPPTGSVHLAGQGRPGYNRWKRITGAQSTRCGHRRRIARVEVATALAGQAQQWVSEWVHIHTVVFSVWTLLDGRHEGVGPVKDRVYCRYSGGGDLTGTLHVSELRFASSPPPTSHAASKSRIDILVPAYLRLPWKLPLNEVCACVILHMLQGYLPFSSTLSSTLQHDTVSQQRINHWPVNCTRNRDALLNDWRRWSWHRSCTDLVPADRRTNTSRTSPAAQTLASSPPSNKHSKLPFENTSYRNLQTGHKNRHII